MGWDLIEKYIIKHASKETPEETELMLTGDLQESFPIRERQQLTRNHGWGVFRARKQNLSHSSHPAGWGPAKTVGLE